MELTITQATKADIDVIVAFSRQLYVDDPSATGEAEFDAQVVRAALVAGAVADGGGQRIGNGRSRSRLRR